MISISLKLKQIELMFLKFLILMFVTLHLSKRLVNSLDSIYTMVKNIIFTVDTIFNNTKNPLIFNNSSKKDCQKLNSRTKIYLGH